LFNQADQAALQKVDYNTAKAEAFYDRVLLGYGDDSVAELGGAHIAIENLSVLATKAIEKHRIGLSPLEKSTRYVYFDKKIDGEYAFYKPSNVLRSKHGKEYLTVMNLLFDTYSLIVRDLQPILREVYPGADNDLAYKTSIRAKACDLARGLLPLSTLTNMGVYGNGRAFEYLLTNLLASPLSEEQQIGEEMYTHLGKIMAPFTKRVKGQRGAEQRQYLQQQLEVLNSWSKLNGHRFESVTTSQVRLIAYDKDYLNKLTADILFSATNLDYLVIKKKLVKLNQVQKEKIINKYLLHRLSRHHKVGKALEQVDLTLEITADFGVYKDLMRHRILSLSRQSFTNNLGFFMPQEIAASPFKRQYQEACAQANSLYLKLQKDFPFEAQYAVLHCSFNRFLIKMNLREATHLVELRSIPEA
jgi:thymidylate synthase ThyX